MYCHKPARGPSHIDRHTRCLIGTPSALYKLPTVGFYHVCPICCTTTKGYPSLVKHMLDDHSYNDFKKVGIQPYMLSRHLKEYNEKYKDLY